MGTPWIGVVKIMEINRGDIVYISGSADDPLWQRPFVIVSNDVGNKYSNICIAVPLTSKHKKLNQPTHCVIDFNDSMVLAEQIYTVHIAHISRVVGTLSVEDTVKVDRCLIASLDLGGHYVYPS